MIYEKILLGISFAAPIGPVTAEAIRRGLLGGFLPAFKIKVGAALGDTLALIIAYYGISTIIKFKLLCQILAILGSILLIYIGYKNIQKGIISNKNQYIFKESLKGGIWLGLGLSLTNPFAIAWWLSVFSSLLIDNEATCTFYGLIENLFIILGILIWDTVLCTLLAFSKRLVNELFIKFVTILAGLSLCGYGIYFGTLSIYKIINL